MATETQVQETSTFEKAEDLYKKYNKFIIGGLILIVLVVAFFVYRGYRLDQKEEAAKPLMGVPQSYFAVDSFRLALFGDGQNVGFVTIADKYSGSQSANLANYYAGISFLQIGDFQKAIDHLEDFDSDSDIIGARAYFAMGHAYAELNNMDKAGSMYEKAANTVDDELFTPYYLKEAGDFYLSQNNFAEALNMYQRIKDEFPNSREGEQIDQAIAYAETKQVN